MTSREFRYSAHFAPDAKISDVESGVLAIAEKVFGHNRLGIFYTDIRAVTTSSITGEVTVNALAFTIVVEELEEEEN